MENPFETIDQRLKRIEQKLETLLSKLDSVDGNENLPKLMTIEQLSEYCHYSKPTIYGYVHQRKIPHCKVGNRLFFEKQQINDWILSKKVLTVDDIEKKADEYLARKGRIRF
jgi:excisionase family DNA binding protein